MSVSPLGQLVDVSEPGRYLAKERGFLVVSNGGDELGRVALDDIVAVVATSPATTVSCALLAELASRGTPFVVCGGNFSPAGLLWPTQGYHAQQRRMEAQCAASGPLQKQIWTRLVRAKISRQAWALAQVGESPEALEGMAARVRAGDPDNLEAQAARRYWPLMMGPGFTRDIAGDGANALLNYGYAVLRAATARAIAAAGLHPGLGVFHRHPQNPMPLADDLMEPFRPVVDLAVRGLLREGCAEVTTDAKRRLAGVLWRDEETKAGTTPLGTALNRLAASVAESFATRRAKLSLPILRMARRGKPRGSGDGRGGPG